MVVLSVSFVSAPVVMWYNFAGDGSKSMTPTFPTLNLLCLSQLLQSMYFSNFVASKLNVWNSNGRHRLEEFLAKMGFSLEQCKQKYPFMSCQLRKRLRDQIEKYAEDYGLQDVFYGKLCG